MASSPKKQNTGVKLKVIPEKTTEQDSADTLAAVDEKERRSATSVKEERAGNLFLLGKGHREGRSLSVPASEVSRWMDERVKAFLATDPHATTFVWTFADVWSQLNDLASGKFLKSSDTLWNIFRIRLELQKVSHKPSSSILKRTLCGDTDAGPCTVVPVLVFDPLLSADERSQFETVVEYFIGASVTKSWEISLSRETRKVLETEDCEFSRRPSVKILAHGCYDWNLGECLDQQGNLVVKVKIRFRWAQFVYYHSQKMLQLRLDRILKADDEKEKECESGVVTLSCFAIQGQGKRVAVIVSKRLLVGSSSVFKDMLETYDSKEKQDGRVDVDDVDSDTMRKMIVYLKTGPQDVIAGNVEDFSRLAYVANKYNMIDLLILCDRLMVNNISADNVLHLYQIACFLNLYDLKTECLMAMKHKPWGKQLALGEFWQGLFSNGQGENHVALAACNDMFQFFAVPGARGVTE